MGDACFCCVVGSGLMYTAPIGNAQADALMKQDAGRLCRTLRHRRSAPAPIKNRTPGIGRTLHARAVGSPKDGTITHAALPLLVGYKLVHRASKAASLMVKRKACRRKGGHTGAGLGEPGRHQHTLLSAVEGG